MKSFLVSSLLFFFQSHAMVLPYNFAPLVKPLGEIIPNEYVVTLKSSVIDLDYGVSSEIISNHLFEVFGDRLTDNLMHVYEFGYAAVMDEELLARVRLNSDVEFVESNIVMHTTGVQDSPKSWGLERISQRKLPLDGLYQYRTTGEGVDVFIIDTGINIAHVDFEGRAEWGKTMPRGDLDIDGNGHGTHVASTVAGKQYGVCKKCKVIAVKVLRSSGYGSMADVLAGVEWAATQHVEKSKKKQNTRSVANMSLGGGKSVSLDRAVDAAVKKGVLFAVAAGNSNQDACEFSPAGSTLAVTVGSTDKTDTRSYFSNWGKCVDIFAPGSGITGAWIGSKKAEKTISGTSMASPHVAGVLALLAHEHPDMSPAELKEHLLSLASVDKISDAGDESPNLLLFSNPNGHAEEPSPDDEILLSDASVMKELLETSFHIEVELD